LVYLNLFFQLLKFIFRFLSIFCTAASVLIGWPFASILGLPIVIEMLIIRRRKLAFKFLFFATLIGTALCLLLFIVDTHFFGKPVLAPLNIVFYNVFSHNGPNLYGFVFYIYCLYFIF
jgi:alpha-1,2-mannosyltransferase